MLLFLCLSSARAQSITQLVEQLALDVQKLSELKAILSDMYKDYEIVNKGYTDIKNIAEGNFNLHKLYLDGLLLVSPGVRNHPQLINILNTELLIVSEYKSAYKRFSGDGHFTLQEITMIGQVYSSLFQRSLDCIDRLTMVTTDNQLRMSDAQRLQAIDGINTDLSGQLAFLRQFNHSTTLQAIQRLRESNDVETLQKIYGITN